MKNLKWYLLASLIGLVSISGIWLFIGSLHQDRPARSDADFIQSSVPTFFLHGWKSSYHAEQQMVNYAKKQGVTTNIIVARVHRSGRVTLSKNLNSAAKNPIVMINFDDNHMRDYHTDAKLLRNVIVKVRQHYHFTRYNLVGHSMANMTIYHFILVYGNDHQLPKLQKIADIAGNYNGILGKKHQPIHIKNHPNMKPQEMLPAYQQLLKLRQTFPKKQIKILNIYGDYDHSGTDGHVANASTLSLKYLLNNRAKSYRVIKITGYHANHSGLHNNLKVDRILVDFLWRKH